MNLEQSDEPLIAEVSVLSRDRRIAAMLLRWDEAPEDADKVKVALTYEAVTLESWSEDGYFRALCDIRRQLESQEALLICYGSSENVYPSPMIEAMGYGEKAYRLTMGRPALNSDLVCIFDVGSDIIPSTVDQQQNFYNSWLGSLQ
jgi:hypothetical protein